MLNEIKEAIEDAKKEFQEYERLLDPLKRIKFFRNAVDILNDILPQVADENQNYTINKMKLNRTRHLLQTLSEIDFQDIIVWFHYLVAMHQIDKEAEIIFKEDPELKKIYDQFVDTHLEEAEHYLKMAKNEKPNSGS